MADDKKKMDKEQRKAWGQVRKAMHSRITVSLGDGWRTHKGTVIGLGLLGAALGVAISEGLWYVFAPGARGGAGHIISDVGGGLLGGGGGTTGGLYLARNQARNQVTLNFMVPFRAFCEATKITPEQAEKLLTSKEFAKEAQEMIGPATFNGMKSLASQDPEAFQAFLKDLGFHTYQPSP